MNNLHDALEACLQDLELGADLESSLRRYPDIADELGPVLEISIYAKELAVSGPSEEVMRRNRAKLLQRAAEMREIKLNAFSNVSWFNSFRRAAVILALLAIIFLSGTGLVTLSTCRGALGRPVAGEGVLGLRRAFAKSGARHVLASLWEIPDRSTAAFMAKYYGSLSSKNPAALLWSMQAAELEKLRGEDPSGATMETAILSHGGFVISAAE